MSDKAQVPTLRIPMAVIGPIYGLIAAVCTVAWNWQESDKSNQIVLTSIQKDVAELSRSMLRFERGLDEYKRDAKRQVTSFENRVTDIEGKLRALQK